jgi:MarR family transcriptional regulator, organic hydroperoxide resistance regulator
MDNYDSDTLYGIFMQVIRFHYYRAHMLLDKIGVYPGQPPLLFIIGKKDGQSQRELAERLHIKAATITIMLNRMEKAKLIERRPDENDQRISRVFLTEQGKKVRLDAIESLKELEQDCFSNFTTEEQLLLRRLFMQMRNNLAKVCDKNWGENI